MALELMPETSNLKTTTTNNNKQAS